MLLDRMPLVTGIHNLMASLRRFSLCTIDDLTPERLSLTHSSSEDQFVFEFVSKIRFIVLANDRECFCCFSQTGIVLFALL